MKQIIYAPIMHSSLAPQGLPDDVLFICPGLGVGVPPRAFTPEGLPFTGREAQAVLAELLTLGAEFSAGGDLKLAAGQGWLEREEARKEDLRAEKAALENFVQSGGNDHKGNEWTRAASAGALSPASQADQFKNSQKALLLAWEHEDNIIAMRELEIKIAEGEERLASVLSEGNVDTAKTDFLPPARPEYSWRLVLDAMSAFLPEEAAIFTAYGPMIEDLRAQGVLEPIPGNIVNALSHWPDELVSSLLAAELPTWRLLGYAALPPDRPWLSATRLVLAAPRLENA